MKLSNYLQYYLPLAQKYALSVSVVTMPSGCTFTVADLTTAPAKVVLLFELSVPSQDGLLYPFTSTENEQKMQVSGGE